MKVNVTVEATAQEMREFFGLPDIKPFQDEMMKIAAENMTQGLQPGLDYTNLMRPFFSFQAEGMESMQRAFWNAFTHGVPRHSTDNDDSGESS